MPPLVKSVSEPWFGLIASGAKTVEGRLSKGDVVEWTNDELGFKRSVRTVVKSVRKYATFKAYLTSEGIDNCLPAYGVDTVAKGVKVYRKFYSAAMEKEHGVLAIRVSVKVGRTK